MSNTTYLVSARKYRPLLFKDVVAQEHAQQGHDDEAAADADHGTEPARAEGNEEGHERRAHERTLTLAIVCRVGSTILSIAGLPSGHGHVR